MFDKSGLVYNALPDNAYDGFQFYEAFEKITKRFFKVNAITASTTLTATIWNQLHKINAGGNIVIDIPAASASRDGDILSFKNETNFEVALTRQGSDTVDGTTSVTLLRAGDSCDLVLDKPNTNWVVKNKLISSEAWIAPAMASGWTNSGVTNPVGYYKDQFGNVRLKGLIKYTSGISGTNITIFSLPAGYRIAYDSKFPVYFTINTGSITSFGNNNFFTVQVTPAGAVNLLSYTGSFVDVEIDLSSISFRNY
jgi:hypothetical protein